VWSGHPARSFFAAAAPARARCASAPQAADFGCLPSPTHPMPRRAPGRFVGSIPEWARGMCPLFGAAVIWRYLGSSRMTLSGRPLEALVLSRFAARAGTQRAGSTAMIPSLISKRCAPLPCASRAPMPDAARSARGCSLGSIFVHPPWPRALRRRRRVRCVNGGMVPPDGLPLLAASNGAQLPGRLEFGLFSPHPAAAF
jgi:hypothetical protein